MPTIPIDGTKIYYELEGEGVPLLLIHMSLCNLRQWAQQRVLGSQTKLLLVDLPGHGNSEQLEGEISIPRLANIIAQLVTKLGFEAVVPVGHSLGGAIAIQLALDYQQLLKGLILIGTGAKLGVYPEILEGIQDHFEEGVELVVSQLGFAKEASPKLIELATTECLRCEPIIGHTDFVACNAFDERARIHEISVPTLVVVGDEDQLTPVKWAQYLADKIPKAELKVITHAGHMVMFEQPNELNREIQTFLRKL